MIYYGYDHRSRLTSEKWTGSAGESIYAYEYDYDGAGNRTRKGLNGTETYYEYYATNRQSSVENSTNYHPVSYQ